MKKTQIFTFVFNRPDLLQKQINCFKKFFIGDCEINVVCDYRDEQYVETFKTICYDNGVKFYQHKSESNLSSSAYHGASVTWAYNKIMLKDCLDDYVLIVDHDMFLIDKFNLVDYMKNYAVSGSLQQRGDVKYVWPGLTMLDISKVKDIEFDFLPCVGDGQMLDTGGGTYALVKKVEFKPFGVEYPESFGSIELSTVDDGYGFELHLDQTFLHFRNACSWHNNYQVLENSRKNEVLNLMLNSFLDNEDILMKEYRDFSLNKSEINEHLPTLYSLAKECNSIVELGVCHGKSTRAFLASGTKLRSYDVWIDPKVLHLFEYSKSIGNDVEYIQKNSVKTEIEECEMLFIDSWHHYYQLRKELKLHADKVTKYLVFHDTVSCGSSGEDWKSWGNGSQIQYETLCNDLDTDKIDNIGINSAIFEFLSDHPEWSVKKHYKNNNGLTVLERHG
jgi:hypothetical protein